MGCGTGALKSCLSILSFFLWLCAVALIVVGGYILVEYKNMKELGQSVEILVPSVVIISAGVFLFIVGLLGCVGALKNNKCCLALFFILMLAILIGEVAAVGLSYFYRGEATDALKSKMHEMISDCGNKTDGRGPAECKEVDYIQRTLKCCGADSYTDWWKKGNVTIPRSCCKNENNCTVPVHLTPNSNDTSSIWDVGCAKKVESQFMGAFQWIFVGTLIVAVLQVLGLVATCVMLCRSKETPYMNLDSQGYRA